MRTFKRISGPIPTRGLLGGAIAAVLAMTAQADVTIEERMSISGAGMMQMANMNGTTTTRISGQRARTDSNLRFESGLMRTFARGVGESTEIVRLDQDKMYSVDNKRKTYSETTLAEQRAQLEQATSQMRDAQAQQRQATSGVDDSQCEWSEPKADVQRSGEKATIAGFQAERVTVTATQSCKLKDSDQVCDFGLMLDQWVAPDFTASAEALAYQRAYAEKLGLGAAASRDLAERAETMFGAYEGIWKEVASKMAEVNGYPVRLSFSLGVGGAQCQNAQQMQASGGQPSPPSIGGALGGALGGLLGKKKAPAPEAAAPVAPMPNGLMPLMGMSTELVAVSNDPIDPQAFEPPAGYKKVAAK